MAHRSHRIGTVGDDAARTFGEPGRDPYLFDGVAQDIFEFFDEGGVLFVELLQLFLVLGFGGVDGGDIHQLPSFVLADGGSDDLVDLFVVHDQNFPIRLFVGFEQRRVAQNMLVITDEVVDLLLGFPLPLTGTFHIIVKRSEPFNFGTLVADDLQKRFAVEMIGVDPLFDQFVVLIDEAVELLLVEFFDRGKNLFDRGLLDVG